MSDFFEEKTRIGAEVVKECVDDYFKRSRQDSLKFINWQRELLGMQLMTQEEHNEFKQSA